MLGVIVVVIVVTVIVVIVVTVIVGWCLLFVVGCWLFLLFVVYRYFHRVRHSFQTNESAYGA